MVFFHKIKQGVADQSYGLNVARLAGIPEAIIHRAEAILNTLQPLPSIPATQTWSKKVS